MALLFSTGERYFSLAISFICIAAVSRLMDPDEIGVSVVGMAIMSMALSAREFVSTNYLIQTPNLSREAVQSAFTIMALFSLVMAGLLLVFAPLIAGIYEDPRLVPYLRVIAVAFLLEVFAAPTLALLRRDMAFGRIALINIVSNGLSTLLVIVLAVMGFGYMSLAWGWLAATTMIVASCLIARPEFWIFRLSLARWRTILTFGGYNGATLLLQRLYEQMPYLVLGRLLSMHHVAIYSRSIMLCQLPDKIIIGGAGAVVLPAFAAEVRNSGNLKKPYLKAIAIISAIQWPALCLLAIMARPAVHLVLGAQWDEVVPLVRIIALAMTFSFGFDLNYPILVSLGAMRDLFLRTAIIVPVSIAVMCAAALVGLEAVAWSLFLIIPFQALVSFHFIRRHIQMEWSELGRPLRESLVVAVSSAGAAFLVSRWLPFGPGLDFFRLGLCAGSALAGWLFGIWLTGHPLGDEIRFLWNRLQAVRGRQISLG